MPAELFMVEVRASDWARSVAWYRTTLGLTLLMDDPAHRFALLGAGAGRIALKAGAPSDSGPDRTTIDLVFQVHDVDAEHARLIAEGIEVAGPIANEAEGYREVRLRDPDGTPIRLFSWTSI